MFPDITASYLLCLRIAPYPWVTVSHISFVSKSAAEASVTLQNSGISLPFHLISFSLSLSHSLSLSFSLSVSVIGMTMELCYELNYRWWNRAANADNLYLCRSHSRWCQWACIWESKPICAAVGTFLMASLSLCHLLILWCPWREGPRFWGYFEYSGCFAHCALSGKEGNCGEMFYIYCTQFPPAGDMHYPKRESKNVYTQVEE